jgi:cyclic-di-GMP-binding protein
MVDVRFREVVIDRAEPSRLAEWWAGSTGYVKNRVHHPRRLNLDILPTAMAAQSSFDIVSEVDLQEVRNAVDQASREIHQRFDFKNTGTALELKEESIEVSSGTEDRLKAAYQVLEEKAVRRKVPLKALQPGAVEPAAKGSVRQSVKLVTGISDDKAKEISKFVRQQVPKIQTQIQGAQVRVMSKSKDDLQAAIAAVKDHDFGIALQFTNYR